MSERLDRKVEVSLRAVVVGMRALNVILDSGGWPPHFHAEHLRAFNELAEVAGVAKRES